MKNIVINGTEYSDISSIVVQTADGTTAEFKDIDEVSSMTVETLTFETAVDLYNKVNEIYAKNPLFTMKVGVTQDVTFNKFEQTINGDGSVDQIVEENVTALTTSSPELLFRLNSVSNNQFGFVCDEYSITLYDDFTMYKKEIICWGDSFTIVYMFVQRLSSIDSSLPEFTFTFYY